MSGKISLKAAKVETEQKSDKDQEPAKLDTTGFASLRATKFPLFNPFQNIHFTQFEPSIKVELDGWNKAQIEAGLLEVVSGDQTEPDEKKEQEEE